MGCGRCSSGPGRRRSRVAHRERSPILCDGLKLVDYWNGAPRATRSWRWRGPPGYTTDTLGGNFAVNGGYSGDEGDSVLGGAVPDSELGGVEVGTAVCRTDTLWVLSHVTLHPLFGSRGAL